VPRPARGVRRRRAAAAHDGHTARTHEHAGAAHALTARQAAFHDAMRKLWEDHITWMRLAIVSFAGGLSDLQATEARLLANQVDNANANQMADFLHAANPHAWPKTTMRAMMKTHLDQTLAEAQHRLQGNFAVSARRRSRLASGR
jgi:hypothetical protein